VVVLLDAVVAVDDWVARRGGGIVLCVDVTPAYVVCKVGPSCAGFVHSDM